MKKLMIAIAVIASACSVHAALYNWKVSASQSMYGVDGDYYTGNGYFFQTGSQQALLTALTDATAADTALATYAGSNGLGGAGAIDEGDFSGLKDAFEWGAASGDKITGYYAATMIKDGINYLFISENETSTAGSTAGAAWATFKPEDASYENVFEYGSTFAENGTGWYALNNVPEPTSGLLLLIGVAGLALRRRRA